MTEWDAVGYDQISALQSAMASEALALLQLNGSERVLDVGCGNGKITAQIARRVPAGSVVGVDASSDMIAFAQRQADREAQPNLRFEVADARSLAYSQQFDLVVSFNALHWIPEQEEALRGIKRALKGKGSALLRLVPKGARKSLEDVLEETRRSANWAQYFMDFRDPYLHATPQDYAALAEAQGLQVKEVEVEDKAWNFQSRENFFAFGRVTFVEWTRRLPELERDTFVGDVLTRYRSVAGGDGVFKFYQMNIRLEA